MILASLTTVCKNQLRFYFTVTSTAEPVMRGSFEADMLQTAATLRLPVLLRAGIAARILGIGMIGSVPQDGPLREGGS